MRKTISKKRWPSFSLRLIFSLSALMVQALQAASDDQNAASVLTMPMKNLSGSADFEYLSGSLSDAITNSMQQKFVYREISKTPQLEQQLESIMRDPETLTPEQLQAVLKPLKIDYYIFGYYKRSATKRNSIEFTNRIYLSGLNKIVEIPSITNKIDGSIFTATERVAGQIVEQIVSVNAGVLGGDKKAPEVVKQEDGKIALSRDAVNVDTRPSKLHWFVGLGYAWSSATIRDKTQIATPNPDKIKNAALSAIFEFMYDFRPEGNNKILLGFQGSLFGTGKTLSYKGKDVTMEETQVAILTSALGWKYRFGIVHFILTAGYAYVAALGPYSFTGISPTSPAVFAPAYSAGIGLNFTAVAFEIRYAGTKYFGSQENYVDSNALFFGLTKRY